MFFVAFIIIHIPDISQFQVIQYYIGRSSQLSRINDAGSCGAKAAMRDGGWEDDCQNWG